MTKLFKDYYLAEATGKEYHFKLKLAVNDVSDDVKDALEKALNKLELLEIGSFTNTPIQMHPVDFPNVRNTKVFMVEFSLAYPATTHELRVYLSDKIGINQQEIAVYNQPYDPRDKNNEEYLAQQEGIDDDEYETALGNEYPVEDEKPKYGKEYNDDFLAQLKKDREERPVEEVENELSRPRKEDNTSVAIPDVGEYGGFSILGGKGGPLS